MLSAVHTLTEDKVDLTSVIIITVVAVTVAVIITASISVCIIRCNDQRNVTYAQAVNPSNVGGASVGPSGRYLSDQRHLMCPSKQGISWPTAVNVNKTHADKIRSAHINQPSRESHSAEKLPNQQKRTASLPQMQNSLQEGLQTNVQDEVILSNSPKNKHYQISSEYHNHPSPKLSHTGHIGKESNSKQGKEIAEVYTSQYCNPHPKQTEQPGQETEMKPLGQTVNYPSDTTIVARGFYTPSLTQNTDNKDSVTEDSNSSDISQQSMGNIYRNPRPLPPVPQ